MEASEAIGAFWEGHAQTIREYLEKRPLYEDLAAEVAYMLKKRLAKTGIEYSAITWRAKTLDSFCEKAVRKGYKSPLEETTDIAAVRIVYLYVSDIEQIAHEIRDVFNVVEESDKTLSESDQFGYTAVHFLVKLGTKVKGARYDDLTDLLCEIQVRTILQDAWAIVDHHLLYKRESAVPASLKRKLNALVGLFETADYQFDKINSERLRYRTDVGSKLERGEKTIIDQPLNLDNLIAYMAWKLPDRLEGSTEDCAILLNDLNSNGFQSLRQLDEAVDKANAAVLAYEEALPPMEKGTSLKSKYDQVGMLRTTMKMVNDEYLVSTAGSKKYTEKVREYRTRYMK